MGISQEFIDRYQSEYDKNPYSRLFAPLAEAYRKMGRLEEAQNLCQQGLQVHASFASGRLAYAKVLLDIGNIEEAYVQLKKATELSPDNLLAFRLLGETCLKLKRPREALKAFKMLLFLHPEDQRAQKAVKKWEFLSAEDFTSESFELELSPPATASAAHSEASRPPMSPDRDLDRVLSLADALTIRNDLERALEVLIDAQMRLGQMPEIETRLQILKRRQQVFGHAPSGGRFESPPKSQDQSPYSGGFESPYESPFAGRVQSQVRNPQVRLKKQKLETLLRRINQKNQ